MVSKYNTERKYREIEEGTGLSKATVQRHMKKFELDGIIATEHPNTPRAYRLVGYEYRRVKK